MALLKEIKLDYSDERILKDLIWERKRELATQEWENVERQFRLGYISEEVYKDCQLGNRDLPAVHIPYPWS